MSFLLHFDQFKENRPILSIRALKTQLMITTLSKGVGNQRRPYHLPSAKRPYAPLLLCYIVTMLHLPLLLLPVQLLLLLLLMLVKFSRCCSILPDRQIDRQIDDVLLIHDSIPLNHRRWSMVAPEDGKEAEKAKNLMKESEREL